MTEQEALDFLEENSEHIDAITDEELVDTSRWSVMYSQVVKDKRTGKFFEISWHRGATEYQDEGIEGVTVMEVFQKTVVTTIYTTNNHLHNGTVFLDEMVSNLGSDLIAMSERLDRSIYFAKDADNALRTICHEALHDAGVVTVECRQGNVYSTLTI